MKKIIISIMVALCALTASAQSPKYEQKGTTFVQVSTKSKGSAAIKTKYTWQDSKGNTYPIYLSKNGKAFVKRTSQKTGKEYNQYLDTEISIKLAKEYNISSNK